jgi:hypothetical protein
LFNAIKKLLLIDLRRSSDIYTGKSKSGYTVKDELKTIDAWLSKMHFAYIDQGNQQIGKVLFHRLMAAQLFHQFSIVPFASLENGPFQSFYQYLDSFEVGRFLKQELIDSLTYDPMRDSFIASYYELMVILANQGIPFASKPEEVLALMRSVEDLFKIQGESIAAKFKKDVFALLLINYKLLSGNPKDLQGVTSELTEEEINSILKGNYQVGKFEPRRLNLYSNLADQTETAVDGEKITSIEQEMDQSKDYLFIEGILKKICNTAFLGNN